ncbi:peptide-methionine (S)-S-oxide reductase MsrA [Brachybacterium sp. YJGR34]|uniref:peptide-methionine (S)-S-oxide reductase MsrA n=1 Tax=Brachybacterium sp. YJGR34 TaxID=2059911 RepID=UPI000E0AD3FD|nr:peptide-methionine (S)-S-oxide reductase MsrA [Brachybacterium sp. YJGR34]
MTRTTSFITSLLGEQPGTSGPELVPSAPHLVTGNSLTGPWPSGHQSLVVGMGCFWGAERLFWELPGVHVTAAGYAGGSVENPSYRQVATGRTGHAEVVRVVFDPEVITLEELLAVFWENHDPTQHLRQGNDVGSEYRSVILTADEEQHRAALASRERYQQKLTAAGHGWITTQIEPLERFHLAEEGHQQYLARHPEGYCHHGFCQVRY